ncbi:MAG: NAD(+) synthase [Terrimicrobiaceae bacterium]|nr:NAD(+) synthase [Terrimicrobiaceae bacterium]
MNAREHADFGYLRVASVAPELRVGDPAFNAARVIEAIDRLAGDDCAVALFPEMCLTGYTCGDLFFQRTLQLAAVAALLRVAEATHDHAIAAVVGLPLEIDGRLFNCAALVAGGVVCGIVPKTYLPNSQEYYEERWFSRAGALGRETVLLDGALVPVGADLLFEATDRPHACIGLEICEDLWAVEPCSGRLTLAGATLILNPSASDELLGKAAYRRDLVRQQSARCLAAYAYAAAGPWESSTDLVSSGHGILAECGIVLAETRAFSFETDAVTADFDLERVTHERLQNSSFSAAGESGFRRVRFTLGGASATREIALRRPVPPRPFVPDDAGRRAENCREIFSIQSTGLARRLLHTGSAKLVLGLSGGLDSTLAALVGVRALGKLGRGPADLIAVVMPGPGSTDRTQDNATALTAALGVSSRVIPIGPAVDRHLADIGHPAGLHDPTYENAQARERTQILMDIANQCGGIVVGTGDLSEAALGWCTFNGDHMSMYHVNAGVPKTLVRHLVEWCAEEEFAEPIRGLLLDIAATPITPELLPLDPDAGLVQKTEETVGPYELHDFFLFQMVRCGFRPAKILALAEMAFDGRHPRVELLRWLRVFVGRFFANQFKRSAMPDGPKVGTVALSPRGDWRMPSDASAAAWLAEVDALAEEVSGQ